MNTLVLFFFVSLASTAIPGPAVLYVTSQTMFGGMRSGLPATLGVLAAPVASLIGAGVSMALLRKGAE